MKTSDKICIVLQMLMVVTALALIVIGLFGLPTKETLKPNNHHISFQGNY